MDIGSVTIGHLVERLGHAAMVESFHATSPQITIRNLDGTHLLETVTMDEIQPASQHLPELILCDSVRASGALSARAL